MEHHCWGRETLQLTLAVGRVRFTGLTPAQLNDLSTTYSRFITAAPAASEPAEMLCEAYALNTEPSIHPTDLTVAGLYTPITRRDAMGVAVIGINFEARIPLHYRQSPASLGVHREGDFALPNVVENFLRILSAYRALHQGGVLLHSAGLVFDHRAWIFVGRSGAGKTTLTRKAHHIGATVLSDDINLLLPGDDGYRAYAVPFTGEFGRTLDHSDGEDSFPVAGIVLLEQGENLVAARVTRAAAMAKLMVGSPFVNTDIEEAGRLLENLAALTKNLPLISLQSRLEDTVDSIMDTINNVVSNE